MLTGLSSSGFADKLQATHFRVMFFRQMAIGSSFFPTKPKARITSFAPFRSATYSGQTEI
jgi:hypothetical protein